MWTQHSPVQSEMLMTLKLYVCLPPIESHSISLPIRLCSYTRATWLRMHRIKSHSPIRICEVNVCRFRYALYVIYVSKTSRLSSDLRSRNGDCLARRQGEGQIACYMRTPHTLHMQYDMSKYTQRDRRTRGVRGKKAVSEELLRIIF